MKTLLVIIITASLCFFFFSRQTKEGSSIVRTSEVDPAKAMEDIAAAVPPQSIFASDRSPYAVSGVSYDVMKTDSTVTPLVGELNFDVGPVRKYKAVFHWRTDKWVFARLIFRDNGKDFTSLPGGLDIIGAGSMREFLDKYDSEGLVPPADLPPSTPAPLVR